MNGTARNCVLKGILRRSQARPRVGARSEPYLKEPKSVVGSSDVITFFTSTPHRRGMSERLPPIFREIGGVTNPVSRRQMIACARGRKNFFSASGASSAPQPGYSPARGGSARTRPGRRRPPDKSLYGTRLNPGEVGGIVARRAAPTGVTGMVPYPGRGLPPAGDSRTAGTARQSFIRHPPEWRGEPANDSCHKTVQSSNSCRGGSFKN